MVRRGIGSHFGELEKRLLIVASDLDAGRRAIFGEGALSTVPVARAVIASSAIPILFAPVNVDGRDYVDGGVGDVGHADLAFERGCSMVVVINPLVPVHASAGTPDVPTGHGRKARVRDKGAIWVYNQAMRMRMEARLAVGLQSFQTEHPDAQVLVVEPKQTDVTLFMYSPMNFAARRAILQEGYTTTVRMLAEPSHPLRRAFEARGFTVAD
jgi:predicted acylesterase/phospholipase RssA